MTIICRSLLFLAAVATAALLEAIEGSTIVLPAKCGYSYYDPDMATAPYVENILYTVLPDHESDKIQYKTNHPRISVFDNYNETDDTYYFGIDPAIYSGVTPPEGGTEVTINVPNKMIDKIVVNGNLLEGRDKKGSRGASVQVSEGFDRVRDIEVNAGYLDGYFSESDLKVTVNNIGSAFLVVPNGTSVYAYDDTHVEIQGDELEQLLCYTQSSCYIAGTIKSQNGLDSEVKFGSLEIWSCEGIVTSDGGGCYTYHSKSISIDTNQLPTGGGFPECECCGVESLAESGAFAGSRRLSSLVVLAISFLMQCFIYVSYL